MRKRHVKDPSPASAAPYPKYLRVVRTLVLRVQGMRVGEGLPTERSIAEEFRVSRATVRRALDELAGSGLVYRIQGSGTYVGDPSMVSKDLHLTSFSEDMRERGMLPESRVLTRGDVRADELTAARLRLAPQTELLRVERLRLADGRPMAVETCFFQASLVQQIGLDFTRSVYAQLREAGMALARAAETIDTVNLDATTAHLLDQAVGAAALRVRRVSYTKKNEPVEVAESVYRGDRYSFDLMVKARR